MKKHLLGILILIIAFVAGFLVSPIRFTSFAVGQTNRGWFTAYSSTYFVKLFLGGEKCETTEEAKVVFESRLKLYSEWVERQENLKLEENRAVIKIQITDLGQQFCVIRNEKSMIYDICSASLEHVLEFEKQEFPQN